MVEIRQLQKQFLVTFVLVFLLGCGSASTTGGGEDSSQESSGEESTEGEAGEQGESACVPECGDSVCGEDGCGGVCGACELGFACILGDCIDPENCLSDEGCSEDGLTSCEEGDLIACIEVMPGCLKWGQPTACADSQCIDGICQCVPDCEDRECGDDGCGGTCGGCANSLCEDGICIAGCDLCGGPDETPICDPDDLTAVKVCTEVDGCLVWTEEPCPSGTACVEGACVESCDECSLENAPKCDPNDLTGLLVCLVQDDCLTWISEPCPDNGSVCDAGECVQETCVADCEGKECGDDGCGAQCGDCAEGEQCTDDFLCVSVPPSGEFGDPCQENTDCVSGYCISTPEGSVCTETCLEQCPEDWICKAFVQGEDAVFVCYPQEECVPGCVNKECGEDGCGGNCGACGAGLYCVEALCVEDCVPSCEGKACGSNGCGGSCGGCEGGAICTADGLCGAICEECSFEPECLNFSFESGDLSGWDTGGAIVVPWFGDTLPKDGIFMMLLSTGGFVDTPSSEAALTTCVPDEALTLVFDWKFYSEEFLEWCGSGFQDSFQVKLVVGDSETMILDYKIDDLCPGGSTGIEVVPSDVIWTLGGVYESPWVSTSVNLPADVGGAPFKLTFLAADAGDGFYDTVVLVDHIRFEACVPLCESVVCGDDGCGGSCGECNVASACNVNGQCKPLSCTDAECPDGAECCESSGMAICVLAGDCEPPDPNSCAGNCGGQADSGCFCNNFCNLVGNCCPDYDEVCGGAESGEEGGGGLCEGDSDCGEGWVCCDPGDVGIGVCTVEDACLDSPEAWSCEDHCGGQAPAGCGCSDACVTAGNCCVDYKEECDPPNIICNEACNGTVVIAEGDQVIPTTTLHLSLEVEDSTECPVSVHEWALTAPESSCASLTPNAGVPSPTVKLDLIGSYEVLGVRKTKMVCPAASRVLRRWS